MAHRPQEGAVGQKVRNVIFLTNSLDFFADLQLGQLNPAQLFLMKFQAWLSLLLSDYELDAVTCKVSDVAFEFFFHMLDNQ